jgi:hypothetical protein
VASLIANQALNSQIQSSQKLRDIALAQGEECYLEVLVAVLNFNGYDGDNLVNHALDFVFQEIENGFLFHPFDPKLLADAIHAASEIIIEKQFGGDWDPFYQSIQHELQKGQPVVVFADSFFVFPEKDDHSNIVLLAYALDQENISLKSTMTGQLVLPLSQFRQAVLSEDLPVRGKNQRLIFRYLKKPSTVDVKLILRTQLKRIRSSASSHGVCYGMVALEKFHAALENRLSAMPLNGFKEYLKELFKYFWPFVQQRKRFEQFLRKNFPSQPELHAEYRKIADNWEILRNMCFKIAITAESNLSPSITKKLHQVIDMERSGLHTLERIVDFDKKGNLDC